MVRVLLVGLHLVRPGVDHDTLVQQLFLPVRALHCRPLEVDLRLRVNHRRADREGIDVRDHAVDRVVGDVADPVVAAERRRERAEHKFHAVEAAIVRAHRVVREVDRAVQEGDFRVLDRLLQGRAHHRGRSCEDDVGTVFHGGVDRERDEVGAPAVLERLRLHDPLKTRGKMSPPKIMAVRPRRSLRLLLVDERRAERLLRGVGRRKMQKRLRRIRIRHVLRLLDELDAAAGRLGQELVPEAVDPVFDLPASLGQRTQRVDLEIRQEGVAWSDGKCFSSGKVTLAEVEIRVAHRLDHLRAPRVLQGLAEGLREAAVAARAAEADVIDRRGLVELGELVVKLDLRVLRLFRKEARDVRHDVVGADEAQHRDALVALLDVEALHVLVDFDRVADALRQLGVVEIAPFVPEFAVVLQKWHEIRGKSLLPPRRPGSRDHVERDLGEADALLREDVLAL